MQFSSILLDRAVDQLATLPGIGRRTAMRLALDLLRREKDEVARFSDAVRNMREHVMYCQECFNISDSPVCGICADPTRDRTAICVVEDIRDVLAIEATNGYKGLYHVLGGVISPMDGIGPDDLHIKELMARTEHGVREVVLALRATVEGDTTNFFIHRKLEHAGVMVSMIARGISVGGDLDQMDEVTLGRSIADRKPYDQVSTPG